MSNLLSALPTLTDSHNHSTQEEAAGGIFLQKRAPTEKKILIKIMHVCALKFYLELAVAFAYEVYQTEAGIGNPGKQMSFGNR